jgi:hypothetical protein
MWKCGNMKIVEKYLVVTILAIFAMHNIHTNQGLSRFISIINNGNPPLYGGTEGNDCTVHTPSVWMLCTPKYRGIAV